MQALKNKKRKTKKKASFIVIFIVVFQYPIEGPNRKMLRFSWAVAIQESAKKTSFKTLICKPPAGFKM